MKKLLSILVSRIFVVGVLIVFQLLFMMSIVYTLSVSMQNVYRFCIILSFLVLIYLINKQGNPSFKLAWSILILLFPLFGGIFYLLFGDKKVPKALRKNMLASKQETLPLLSQETKTLNEIKECDESIYKQFNYVWKNTYFPVYKNVACTYCSTGEVKFDHLVKELKKAEKFIFLEYFIIGEGIFWNTILEILKEKAKKGVLVRVMYDDAGCVSTLPANYRKILQSMGIECCVFNPLHAKLAVQMNNRDHRKIAVIDNRVGFVGGINLADEYINEKVRFGHWKDTAIMVEGEAVWSLTVMFLQFWDYLYKEKNTDYIQFKLDSDIPINENDGYIQLVSDSPTDNEEVGLNMHMNMINNAKKYVYIQTPYLVIGYEMQKALTLAAKNGIDVRITVPHVPDKWYVHLLTQANYEVLIDAGVRIYEYTPGFIHSKTFVSDDIMAFCGTINMDYRSYYLHYECGALLYKGKVINDMKIDYLKTLECCQEISLEDCKKTFVVKRLVQAILNLFSPMM